MVNEGLEKYDDSKDKEHNNEHKTERRSTLKVLECSDEREFISSGIIKGEIKSLIDFSNDELT